MYWKEFFLHTDVFRQTVVHIFVFLLDYFYHKFPEFHPMFTILFWFFVAKLQPENHPQLRYFERNVSNIQPNWGQHSYNKLGWLKYRWQTVKDSRSGCNNNDNNKFIHRHNSSYNVIGNVTKLNIFKSTILKSHFSY